MPLDKATVRHIARLARIRVAEDDLDSLAGELNHIIGWVEQLSEVDTEGVEPLTSVADMTLKMRPDGVDDGGCPDQILANAPAPAAGFFTVPKVVE